jgi:2-amino-4-hydroxy-6-hydroxymethyldihydropteridine diphosphokinase
MTSGSETDDHAWIALGANLGDRLETLRSAMDRLENLSTHPILRSSFWTTTPVDCPPGSPMFLNAVVAIVPFPAESPESLLAKLQALEKEYGRRAKKRLNEPRPLDLDLIAWGDRVAQSPLLTLPHPRAHERRFVLQPLSEIAPKLIIHGQSRTVAELLANLPPGEIARKMI